MSDTKNASDTSLSQLTSLSTSLLKESLESSTPSPERCMDILNSLSSTQMTISLLDKSQIGKTLTRAIKSFKRHKRTSPEDGSWNAVQEKGEQLLQSWKDTADSERKKMAAQKKKKTVVQDDSPGLPASVEIYRARLVKQKKEMYKDPPFLPPPSITIEDETYPPPKRNKSNGELTFQGHEQIRNLLNDFHPNLTPEEIIRGGSFGGTYFRPITSAVTNVRYNPSQVLQTTVKPEWIETIDAKIMLTSSTYRPQINQFKVNCGGSLGMWESSGWIADSDPYGWFQWYCRFYSGRRCSDDRRQIQRWMKSAGGKGRFRSQLCNKIMRANKKAEDVSVSPVIRQTLWHWGIKVNEALLEKHRKRVGF